MKKKIEPLSLEGIQTYPLLSRKSLVRAEDFARPLPPRASFSKFLSSLPNFLAAKDFREIVARIASAHRRGKPVLLGMGAHPLKVGLSPLIIRLLERGILQGVAMNGAGIIHDFEIACAGRTSEDVAAEIGSGSFGMAEETGQGLNEAIRKGWEQSWGIGYAVGAMIQEKRLPYRRLSITAAGFRLGIPVTVHVAVGTDIIHLHPQASGEAIGEGSHRDFRLFAALISRLRGGRLSEFGLGGDPAGGFSESLDSGKKPRVPGQGLHHGQPGFYPPLPAPYQRRPPPHPRRGEGVPPHRPS